MSLDVLAVNISVCNKLFLTENFEIKDSQYESKFTIIHVVYILLFGHLSLLFIGCLITSFFGWGWVLRIILQPYIVLKSRLRFSSPWYLDQKDKSQTTLHNFKILTQLWSYVIVEFGYFSVLAQFNFVAPKFISFIIIINVHF